MIGRKSGIRRKILFLLLGVGLLSFVALSAISLRGMYGIQNNAVESGNAMGEAVADYVEDFAAEKTKRQLLILADKKSKQVETELGAALENAEDLVAGAVYALASSYAHRKAGGERGDVSRFFPEGGRGRDHSRGFAGDFPHRQYG